MESTGLFALAYKYVIRGDVTMDVILLVDGF
jgi:hypothetical protein